MIVVLGAGLAGLSAAYKLIELGYEDFIVVEAKNRAGGRVESIHFQDGVRIDIGAQWLHGGPQNPVYSWLESLKLIKGPEKDMVEFDGSFRIDQGHILPKDVIHTVLDVLLEAKDFLYKKSNSIDSNSRPVDVYREFLRDAIENLSALKGVDIRFIQAVMNWFELYEMIDNSCEDLSKLSMKAYSNWENYDDGKMFCLRGGWQGVINKLVELVGPKRLLLGKLVKRVSYSKNGARVDLLDGTKLDCDHVIITFSVGVLKNLDEKFFEPPLIDERRLGFKKIGFDCINKIFLQFERPFLRKKKGLKLLWLNDRDDNAEPQLGSQGRQNSHYIPPWARYITGFDRVDGAPNFLVGWIGSKGARLVENCHHEEVGQVCVKILRRFLLPSEQPPKLVSVYVSRWATDEHFRGSYSYESTESVDIDKEKLWAPLHCDERYSDTKADSREQETKVPRILFAGEATAGAMYSTAHGAIVSGWREATRLSKFLKTS